MSKVAPKKSPTQGAPWTPDSKPKSNPKSLEQHRSTVDLKDVRRKLKKWQDPFRKV